MDFLWSFTLQNFDFSFCCRVINSSKSPRRLFDLTVISQNFEPATFKINTINFLYDVSIVWFENNLIELCMSDILNEALENLLILLFQTRSNRSSFTWSDRNIQNKIIINLVCINLPEPSRWYFHQWLQIDLCHSSSVFYIQQELLNTMDKPWALTCWIFAKITPCSSNWKPPKGRV